MLHAWTLEYQHMMLCVWQWICLRKQKGNGQMEKTAGSPLQRLAQQGSWGCQRSTAIYAVETWDRLGARSGATVHSDYAKTMMMMKDDLCQKWRVKLIFQGTYTGCPEPGLLSVWKSLTWGVIWNSLTQRPTEDAFFIFGRKRKCRRKMNSIFGRKQKSPVPTSQNLVTVQLRT